MEEAEPLKCIIRGFWYQSQFWLWAYEFLFLLKGSILVEHSCLYVYKKKSFWKKNISKFPSKYCFSSCVYHLFPVCFCLNDLVFPNPVSLIYKITTTSEDWAKIYKVWNWEHGSWNQNAICYVILGKLYKPFCALVSLSVKYSSLI